MRPGVEMPSKYDDVVKSAKTALAKAILEREGDLASRARGIDGMVLELLREVGRETVEDVLNAVSSKETTSKEEEGLTVQHRDRSPFLPSSGK